MLCSPTGLAMGGAELWTRRDELVGAARPCHMRPIRCCQVGLRRAAQVPVWTRPPALFEFGRSVVSWLLLSRVRL